MAHFKVTKVVIGEGESVSIRVEDPENEVICPTMRAKDFEANGYHPVEKIRLVTGDKIRAYTILRKNNE